MATVKVGYGRSGFGDAQPLIDAVLRDLIDDVTSINGGAVPALTSVQEATTNAVDLATSEALANSLKIKYNALQADVAALRAALSAEATTLKSIKG